MTTTSTQPELSISLNPHLLSLLDPLPPLLPPHLKDQLLPYLTRPEQPISQIPTIPYALLLSISRWSRTAAIDRSQYTMVNLLAGCTTAPNARFAPPEEGRRDSTDADERRAIVALVNMLVSVVGSGVAGWWVASGSQWDVGLRVLLTFGVASIVALSETILFVIWQTRRDSQKRRIDARYKKDDGSNEGTDDQEVTPTDNVLRQRTRTSPSE